MTGLVDAVSNRGGGGGRGGDWRPFTGTAPTLKIRIA
jgi:hypothetical protein